MELQQMRDSKKGRKKCTRKTNDSARGDAEQSPAKGTRFSARNIAALIVARQAASRRIQSV